MYERSIRKSIPPYLKQGEEVLNVTFVQAKGIGAEMMRGSVATSAQAGFFIRSQQRDAEAAASEDELKPSTRMGLAITSQRFLVFMLGGMLTLKAKKLLAEVPIADVESIEVGKGTVSTPYDLVSALEQAKALSAT
jgi:hypothetical protein